MAHENIFDSDGTHHINVKFRDDGGARDKLRFAIDNPVLFTAESVTGLTTDPDINLLDWMSVMMCVDLGVGASSFQCWISGYDKTGSVSTLVDQNIEWSTKLNELAIGALQTGDIGLGGSLQLLWVSSGYVDFSVAANRAKFVVDGVPQDPGASKDYGTGVTPFLFLENEVGGSPGPEVNSASTNGAFNIIGVLEDDGTYPLLPGATLPSGIGALLDDTFSWADALLGDQYLIASGGYGTQQTFTAHYGDIFDAIGVTILQRMQSSPTNRYPVTLASPVDSVGDNCAMKGGVVKNTDDYDRALDVAVTPTIPAGIRSQVNNVVFDGVRLHNVIDGIQVELWPGSNGADQDRDTVGTFEVRNSWISYCRRNAINNPHHLSGIVEDCLIDGCYTFMSAANPTATVDSSASFVEIRNCLIWLRALPYPLGHSGEELGAYPFAANQTAWGHGPIWDWSSLAPGVKIYDSVFYIEHLPSTGGDAADRLAQAPDTLGFINQYGTKLLDASNVTIVYGRNVAYEGTIPSGFSSEFTIHTYGDDPDNPKTYFFLKRNQWILDHPLVGVTGVSLFDGSLNYDGFSNQPFADYPSF